MQTLTSCLRRYAVGSPPVRSSRWDVADQTSRVPSTDAAASTGQHQHPVDPGGAQAESGHRMVSCRLSGGRIEPSWLEGRQRVGRRRRRGSRRPGGSHARCRARRTGDSQILRTNGPRGARAGAALGDHHQHDVVLVVGGDPRGRLLAVDLGRAGLGADVDLVEGEADQLPRHRADLGGAEQRVVDVGDARARGRSTWPCTFGLDPPDHLAVGADDRLGDAAARRACRRWTARRRRGPAAAA